MMRSIHSGRLERWLGKAEIENMSAAMRGWYGGPIACAGVPGNVHVCADGDFVGRFDAGWEAGLQDWLSEASRRVRRGWRHATRPRQLQLNSGFSSLSNLIAEANGGKRQDIQFTKVCSTADSFAATSYWNQGTLPPTGADPAAAPGGRAPDNTTVGAFPFNSPVSGDTAHFVGGTATVPNTFSVLATSLLIYDRIFDVAKTMSSTGTEAVTGVPTRYQGSTRGAADFPANNFLTVEVGAALSATAHNWTVCQYTDQDGNTGATLPSFAGVASLNKSNIDVANPNANWFAPLASGDDGIKALTQMQCSASVTGGTNFVIGHPIAWLPIPVSNGAGSAFFEVGGINSAFNLARIFDGACLALLEVRKGQANTGGYRGTITLVSG